MIIFGPSGNCEEFYNLGLKHTIDSPKWLNSLGLTAYEYSFTRGVNINNETAKLIGDEMKKYKISVSAHAPYYINFANTDDEMVEKSFGYVLSSLQKLKIMGGRKLVVHIGSIGKLDRIDALELTKTRLIELVERIKLLNLDDMFVCLECLGKSAQIGSIEEILDFCTIWENYLPTIDFGHINALTNGTLKSEEDYEKIIKLCIEKIGIERTKICHIHFSKIEYSLKGEIRHLTLDDQKYGPEFLPLAKVIKKYNLEPSIICESKGTQTKDAVKLKEIFDFA